MNSRHLRSAAVLFLSLRLFPAPVAAQAVAPAAASAPTAKAAGETVQLSPFEVSTDKDTSYGALNLQLDHPVQHRPQQSAGLRRHLHRGLHARHQRHLD